MHTPHVRPNVFKWSLGHGSSRTAARNLTLGALAAALIATAALPAFAGKPDHRRHGGHAQEQQQDTSAAGKRRNKNKSKSVTKTFANEQAIAIPALGSTDDRGIADPYLSAIDVSGFKRKPRISDVNVILRDFSHAFGADVALLLVALDGRNALIMADAGNPINDEAFTKITLTLDDEAAKPLPAEGVLESGSFRPLDGDGPGPNGENDLFVAPAPAPSGQIALSTFDGIDPNGEWQLFVLDDGIGDTGAFEKGWALEITAKSKGKKKNKR